MAKSKKSSLSALLFFVMMIFVMMIFAGCAHEQHSYKLDDTPSKLPEFVKTTRVSEDPLFREVMRGLDARKSSKEWSPLVSGSYFETDLRTVLTDLALKTDRNIIPDQTVQGIVTIEFTDSHLENVLEMILFPGGYTYVKRENYYLVGTIDPRSPSYLKFLEIENILTNRPAKEIMTMLPSSYVHFLRTNEKAGNLLTVTAPSNLMVDIKKNILLVDSPKRQIVIEVIITDISFDEGSSYGIEWGEPIGSLGGEAVAEIKFKDGIEFGATSKIMTSLLSRISALNRTGRVDLRANPKVVVLEGEEATVEVQTEQYFAIERGEGQIPADIKSIKSGIILKVTPWFARNGEITLRVRPEVSDVVGSGGQGKLPVITRRSIESVVRVNEGETVVIGGLYQQIKRIYVNSLLPVENLPILDFPFSKNEQGKKDMELAIFITPRLLRN